jgi:hypothetical protein
MAGRLAEMAADNKIISLSYARGKIDKEMYQALIDKNMSSAYADLETISASEHQNRSAAMRSLGASLMNNNRQEAPKIRNTNCQDYGSTIHCTTF